MQYYTDNTNGDVSLIVEKSRSQNVQSQEERPQNNITDVVLEP